MARRSYQRGWIEEGKEGSFFIRYRVRMKEGSKIAPREALPEGTTRKQALARLDEAMLRINKRNNVPDLPTNGTFAQYTEGVWVSIACGIKVGQEYLRHQDYKTTANIYWHLDDAALRQATELLAGQPVGAMNSDRISSVTAEQQKMEQLLH